MRLHKETHPFCNRAANETALVCHGRQPGLHRRRRGRGFGDSSVDGSKL